MRILRDASSLVCSSTPGSGPLLAPLLTLSALRVNDDAEI